MNRSGWTAVAVLLVLIGAWTFNFGYGIREDVPCNDTDEGTSAGCELPPMALSGKMFVTAGALAMVSGIGIVISLRGQALQR